MALPPATVRPDAVNHYAALLTSHSLLSEALCLTAVRGLPVDQALVRFDGFPDDLETTLAAAGRTAVSAYPDELPVVVADHREGWTLLAEDNGFHGSMPEVLSRLSAGTVAASAYWNVNSASRASLAHDGRVLAVYDFVIGGPPDGAEPDRIAPFLEGLDFDDAYRMCASALAFLERVSGVRIPADWSAQPHPASVIAEPARFEPPQAGNWLSIATPRLAAAVPRTDASRLRRVAALAATRACQVAGIDDPAVLESLAEDAHAVPGPKRDRHRERLAAQAREAYRQALHLRWDRCTPTNGLDATAQPRAVAELRAAMARRRLDTGREQVQQARAHAIAAAQTRMRDDPVEALALTLFNACQTDRKHWPALLDELTTQLTGRAR